MKLLITTQKVDLDDDVLGFFYGWIVELAKYCEKVTVISLYKGKCDLPDNVKILSLGKEDGSSKFKYLFRFYKYIWQERKNYDTVFVHMNPEYVVLGGIFWKIWRKKIFLWYSHKAVDWKLRIAEKLAANIFTASPESFGIKSGKVKVSGHGINLKQFSFIQFSADKIDKFRIVYVGRISKIKNQELLIRAIDILVNKNNVKNIEVSIAGGAIYPADKEYLDFLQKLAQESKLDNNIKFIGSIPNKEIADIYKNSDLSINLCPTGGMDKAVLESWASGKPCVVFNKTFSPTLHQFPELVLEDENAEELAKKIKANIEMNDQKKNYLSNFLRNEVVSKHSLENLIASLIKLMA
jgi:glycosyltransferase involved in cell wall biosynthesis